MRKEAYEKIYEKLEITTRKWWFLLLFILLGTIVPPITTKGFETSKIGEIIPYLLAHALIYSCPFLLYIIFKIVPIILISCLVLFGHKVSRIFSLYVGITYVLFAVLQGVAVTDKYGFGIVTGNFILMSIVAIFWFWEVFTGRNDFTPRRIPITKYWVIPLAFLAFWYPINLETLKPDFDPVHLFSNMAGLAFCLMTPVYLGILTLYYPKVNIATLRVTSLSGILIGFWNMVGNFFAKPDVLWWNGILHLPLVAISIYAFVLSLKKLPKPESKNR